MRGMVSPVTEDEGFDIDDPDLERELLLSIAEADAGDVIPAEEVLRDLRSCELTPEQEAELEESNAEYERGEWIDGDELMERLRSRDRATPAHPRTRTRPR